MRVRKEFWGYSRVRTSVEREENGRTYRLGRVIEDGTKRHKDEANDQKGQNNRHRGQNGLTSPETLLFKSRI